MTINQADSTTQTSERTYRHLFENMPVCIFVADLTVTPAVILEVNRRTELVYGYTAAELVGNPAAHLVPEESRASVNNMLERVKQGESVNISAIVTNHGEVSGDHVLVLNLKGAEESVQEVTLGPGESQRVDFNIIKSAPGFYNVDVEGLRGRFVVEMEWQDTLKI